MKKKGMAVLATAMIVGMAMNTEIDFVSDLQNALEEKGEEAGIRFVFTNANNDA